ncbi:histidine phosphatase family protein [Tropicimonas sp.]|uniref:histidine phosphatase family protein n=1 Tax=Tropicimonas sp. TaxID=2067044 RepID=UPI003A85E139
MLLILRHGETEWNRQGRMQGHLDSPLTRRGAAQARAQGAVLRRVGAAGLPLFCSPLGRAKATAELALPGRSPIRDARLNEVGMGAWQGLTMAEIRARHPQAFHGTDAVTWKFSAPGGETLDDIWRRVSAFLSDLSGPAVVVTHGVTSQVLRAQLTGLAPASIGTIEDRQGVVYRVEDGCQTVLDPPAEPDGQALLSC